jgi:hypothetical protein
MENQRLLVILLLFLGWPDCALGERGVFLRESTAAETGEAIEEQLAPPEMFSTPSVGYVFDPDTKPCGLSLERQAQRSLDQSELGMAVRRAWCPRAPSSTGRSGRARKSCFSNSARPEAPKSLTGLPMGANRSL